VDESLPNVMMNSGIVHRKRSNLLGEWGGGTTSLVEGVPKKTLALGKSKERGGYGTERDRKVCRTIIR